MADTKLNSYSMGSGRLITLDHVGPASYATGGETIGMINSFTGVTAQGFGSLDLVIGGASLSGNYEVVGRATGTGSRQTLNLVWKTLGGAQVAAAVNLSGETVRLGLVGR